ncbi:hypothetical protein AQUCO_112400002v1 [Aquilegia coerulea]|uniref:Uncharacterized protein n=1 Tax=Aquilegia coerulea TaxID=218851 RepID=A0A2G5C084_AQUCA|nr:hypothetical protein AQUCO_112400002v1 [Aquilegia coerulea]
MYIPLKKPQPSLYPQLKSFQPTSRRYILFCSLIIFMKYGWRKRASYFKYSGNCSSKALTVDTLCTRHGYGN